MQHAPTPSLPSPGGKDKATEFHVIVCMMMTSVNEMIYGLRPEKLGYASAHEVLQSTVDQTSKQTAFM